ncbi:MAG: amino acid ABC transporter permease [Firmicutes bacterium]|nr:amino acid ABC transporter permease [Bacillota bacterium]
MNFRWDLMWKVLPSHIDGAIVTLKLTAFSVFMGIVLGTLLGMGRLSQRRTVALLSGAYVDFFRGTPLLVQIFVVYMGLPQLGLRLSNWVAALTALSLNSGAYVAEIVRSGIQSVDKGQVEAARSLGMTSSQTMQYVVLPQAFRRIIPPLGNEFIALLKDSSLVAVISLEELLRKGQINVTRFYRPFEIYIQIAIIYLIMTKSISFLINWVEKRMKLDEQRLAS